MSIDEKRYYSVKCKCGHVGRKYYIPVEFAVKAFSKKEASEIARMIPRCKHDHKDCILEVKEITFDEFIKLCEKNEKDIYLQCHSIQEQSKYDLSERLVEDPHYIERNISYKNIEIQKHPVFNGKTHIRNPKRYIRLNQLMEAYN